MSTADWSSIDICVQDGAVERYWSEMLQRLQGMQSSYRQKSARNYRLYISFEKVKSRTCNTDLKARPQVAERAARKPIRLNSGSPPVAMTIPGTKKQCEKPPSELAPEL